MAYEPVYTEGEILVHFTDRVSPDEAFAQVFGNALGDYQLKERRAPSTFLYGTSPGMEETAIEQFQDHEWVDWAHRRDEKLEDRLDTVETLEEYIEAVEDTVIREAPRAEYDTVLAALEEAVEDARSQL